MSYVTDARVGFSSIQYITSEGEGEVQVKVSVLSSLDLIRESISGTFSVSVSAGGTAVGKWRQQACAACTEHMTVLQVNKNGQRQDWDTARLCTSTYLC